MAVYSRQFGQLRTTAVPDLLFYTVPAGYVAVVRDIVLYVDIDQTPGQIAVYTISGSNAVMIYREISPTPGVTYHWDGRQVLNAGQSLYIYSDAGRMVALVSGYELGA